MHFKRENRAKLPLNNAIKFTYIYCDSKLPILAHMRIVNTGIIYTGLLQVHLGT